MRFIIFYKGPATPPDASHEGWPNWFNKVGDRLIDVGSPMVNGLSIISGGQTDIHVSSLNGFSIVEAANADELRSLVADHPYLLLGEGYAIEAFEIPKK